MEYIGEIYISEQCEYINMYFAEQYECYIYIYGENRLNMLVTTKKYY